MCCDEDWLSHCQTKVGLLDASQSVHDHVKTRLFDVKLQRPYNVVLTSCASWIEASCGEKFSCESVLTDLDIVEQKVKLLDASQPRTRHQNNVVTASFLTFWRRITTSIQRRSNVMCWLGFYIQFKKTKILLNLTFYFYLIWLVRSIRTLRNKIKFLYLKIKRPKKVA